VIVRSWHGLVPLQHAEAFAAYLQRTGVSEATALAGNRGAQVTRRSQGAYEHFFLQTYWDNLEAVRAFAGDDYQIAVTYPEDDAYGLISDPIVLHHEVAAVPTNP